MTRTPWPKQKGKISQRDLVPILKVLVDHAAAKGASAHRDIARQKLRELLADPEINWRTTYIYNNISPRRCRYIASMGFGLDYKYLNTWWKIRPGEEPPVTTDD